MEKTKEQNERLVVIEKAKISWSFGSSSIHRGGPWGLNPKMMITLDPNEDADLIARLTELGYNCSSGFNRSRTRGRALEPFFRIWIQTPIQNYMLPHALLSDERLVEYFDFQKWDEDHHEFVSPVLLKNIRNGKTSSAKTLNTIDDLDKSLMMAEKNNYDVDVVAVIKVIVMPNDRKTNVCYLRSIRIHKEDK